MPKVKLDAAFCLTAACSPGKRKTDYWDTITTGFVLEVRASGGRSYYLRYFDAAGRQRQHKIGGHGDISFDQARKAARRLRSEVVLGGDPSGTKADMKAIPFYADLAVQHLAHAKTYQRSYDSTEMIMRRHVLPHWGKQRLDEIRPHDIAKWLAAKAEEGYKPPPSKRSGWCSAGRSSSAGSGAFPGATTTPSGRCPVVASVTPESVT